MKNKFQLHKTSTYVYTLFTSLTTYVNFILMKIIGQLTLKIGILVHQIRNLSIHSVDSINNIDNMK